MSDAKRCDRCGAFYTLDISDEKDDVAGIALLDKYGRTGRKLDLCQKCREEIREWMDGLSSVQKVYDNCAFKNVGILQEPCAGCQDYDYWKPRKR